MKAFTLGPAVGRLIGDGRSSGTDDQPPSENTPAGPVLPESEPYRSLAESVLKGDVAGAGNLAAQAVQDGVDPLDIALHGLLKGMDAVSDLYNRRQAFVPEVLLAARALDAGLQESGGERDALGRKGVVIIHTAEGDLHDIGKNIVAAIVEANGFRVIDLGTSVETPAVLAAIREYRPIAVVGSSLMTSTRGAFLTTADHIRENGISIPFIVGGSACDERFAAQRDTVQYARDPAALVKILNA
ncbi:MAG: cobalamin-dependent protein, partial [Methanoculleus sp.]|nr:cobalamin-dependent protein [Methanoculleus sp.]